MALGFVVVVLPIQLTAFALNLVDQRFNVGEEVLQDTHISFARSAAAESSSIAHIEESFFGANFHHGGLLEVHLAAPRSKQEGEPQLSGRSSLQSFL